MADAVVSAPKRLLRILLGGAVLAAAWVAIDLVTHSESASAVEVPDVSITDVAPAVAPLVTQVAAITAPVLQPVEQAVAPIVAPPLEAIVPVVEVVVAPLVPVVEAVVPPLVPTITEIAGTLALAESLGLAVEAAPVSTGGNGVALATSAPPLLPTPVGGTPRDLPAVPTSNDQAGGPAAELNSAFLAPPGSVLTLHTGAGGTPSSPTYGFDTTPD